MLNHQIKIEVHVRFEKRFHTVFVYIYSLFSLDKKCKHNEAKNKTKNQERQDLAANSN